MKKKREVDFDKEKTNSFYETYNEICECVYCRNFLLVIRKSYPKLMIFLEQFGIIVEKPIEAFEQGCTKDNKRYYQAMYSVSGTINQEFILEIEENIDVEFCNSDRLFDTGMDEPYFLVQVYNLQLNWELEEQLDD